MMQDVDFEEEELGGAPTEASDKPKPVLSGFDDEDKPKVALFAVGALAMLLGIGLLVFGMAGEYYEVAYRQGSDPGDGPDQSPWTVHTLALRDWELSVVDEDGNTIATETVDYAEDAPIVGVAMDTLRATAVVGAMLASLAFIAAILHRLGALTVAGPAPIMAIFAGTFLVVGTLAFVFNIPGLARFEWVGGRLSVAPAFFTSNVDGNLVHDLAMRPLLGFYLHAGGVLLVVLGTLGAFWDAVAAFKAKARSLAEEAVVD